MGVCNWDDKRSFEKELKVPSFDEKKNPFLVFDSTSVIVQETRTETKLPVKWSFILNIDASHNFRSLKKPPKIGELTQWNGPWESPSEIRKIQ